jgi:hypothetical protein
MALAGITHFQNRIPVCRIPVREAPPERCKNTVFGTNRSGVFNPPAHEFLCLCHAFINLIVLSQVGSEIAGMSGADPKRPTGVTSARQRCCKPRPRRCGGTATGPSLGFEVGHSVHVIGPSSA